MFYIILHLFYQCKTTILESVIVNVLKFGSAMIRAHSFGYERLSAIRNDRITGRGIGLKIGIRNFYMVRGFNWIVLNSVGGMKIILVVTDMYFSNSKSFIIVTMYNLPGSNEMGEVLKLIHNSIPNYRDYHLVNDLNAHHSLWCDYPLKNSSGISQQLYLLINP